MKELTPDQFAKAKMVGHLWGTIGLILALTVLLMRSVWYFVVFMLAMIWLQAWEYKRAKQDYKGIIKMMQEVNSPIKSPNWIPPSGKGLENKLSKRL